MLAFGIVSATGLMLYARASLDAAARVELAHRVELALAVESDELENLAVEYSYWFEAHQQLVQAPSEAFAEDNIGSYITDHQKIAISLVVDAEGEQTIAFLDGLPAKINVPDMLQAGLASALLDEQQVDEPAVALSGVFEFERSFYHFAVSSFIDDDEFETADGSYLVFARRIDNEFLARMESKFQLTGLRMSSTRTQRENLVLSITDPGSRELFVLTWNDPVKSQYLSIGQIGFLLAILGGMSLLAFYIGRSELLSQRRYSDLLLEMAYCDPLTGAPNRRDFFEKGELEVARCIRMKYPLSLLMLDIDEFKQVNDDLGHAVGDEVLIAFVECLNKELRSHDLMGRIGGEEFAIVMPHYSSADVMTTAERVRAAVAQMHNSASAFEQEITVSIGVAEMGAGETLQALMERADQALYLAKNSGRNCCVFAKAALSGPRSEDGAAETGSTQIGWDASYPDGSST
jgi:diguanylate cyclase (GGDEF)-like protein